MRCNDIREMIPLVKFLGKVLGPNAEVVLHDLKNYDNSIVAIENGHISGRKPGGPVTDLVLSVIKNKRYEKEDFVTNYTGKSKSGNLLKSSTFYLKNDRSELIGLLCTNIDMSVYMDLDKKLRQIINYDLEEDVFGQEPLPEQPGRVDENFGESLEDLTASSIESIVSEYGVTPGRMSPDEKIEIVRQLNEKGVFLLKGEVSRVAKYLNVSDATVYRYLSKIR
ncbi:helix-turn-helix transcriptional regulator [Anaerotalea alkaliphila]|uniref:YheO-like PAS domain protein n=1 Tax=Anaerotalea alkaliphila TaxID=2662126 RepID=A0A7X5HV64_9FIRM|nr:PAS domain-containing protein [Anaerotalea alkaliphila]NDL67046.1 YheO-like PAS domain protein [Anaerotalea alkaliphila]